MCGQRVVGLAGVADVVRRQQVDVVLARRGEERAAGFFGEEPAVKGKAEGYAPIAWAEGGA